MCKMVEQPLGGGGGGDACIVACTLDGSTVATFIIAYMYKIGVLVAILVV